MKASARKDILTFADVVLDLTTYRVSRNGQEISLTPRQFKLLRHLLEHPYRVCTRTELSKAIGCEDTRDLRGVDVHIARLRKALQAGGGPNLIRTVTTVGYALG